MEIDPQVIQSAALRSVCLVSQWAVAGTETFIKAHCDYLPAKVCEVTDVPPKVNGQQIPIPLWRKMGRYLRCQAGLYSDDAEVLKDYIHIFRIRRAEVVLAEYGTTGVKVIPACRQLGLPLVVHFHGFDAYRKNILDDYGESYRQVFDYASAVISVSADMSRKLEDIGAPPNKIHLIPYGVDTDLREPGDCSSSAPLFIAVGRFVEKKAPHLALLAFAKVIKECPDARLVMYGDGPLLNACRDIATGLSIEGAVTFAGHGDHDVVLRQMRVARCFVQHSVVAQDGDSEGTPVAVLEAGAAALPVVATRHGGITDAVVHGETGFLVTERDVNSMADYMIMLAKDPVLASKIGNAARNRVESLYSLRKSIGRLWAVIENSAAGSRCAR